MATLISYLAGEALLVPGHGVPVGHADLLERAARLHRPADDAHAQVLLLDRQPSGSHGNRAKGNKRAMALFTSMLQW